MLKLVNVIDIRTSQFHSIAIVKERNAKWFVPYVEEEPEPVVEEPVEEVIQEVTEEPDSGGRSARRRYRRD